MALQTTQLAMDSVSDTDLIVEMLSALYRNNKPLRQTLTMHGSSNTAEQAAYINNNLLDLLVNQQVVNKCEASTQTICSDWYPDTTSTFPDAGSLSKTTQSFAEESSLLNAKKIFAAFQERFLMDIGQELLDEKSENDALTSATGSGAENSVENIRFKATTSCARGRKPNSGGRKKPRNVKKHAARKTRKFVKRRHSKKKLIALVEGANVTTISCKECRVVLNRVDSNNIMQLVLPQEASCSSSSSAPHLANVVNTTFNDENKAAAICSRPCKAFLNESALATSTSCVQTLSIELSASRFARTVSIERDTFCTHVKQETDCSDAATRTTAAALQNTDYQHLALKLECFDQSSIESANLNNTYELIINCNSSSSSQPTDHQIVLKTEKEEKQQLLQQPTPSYNSILFEGVELLTLGKDSDNHVTFAFNVCRVLFTPTEMRCSGFVDESGVGLKVRMPFDAERTEILHIALRVRFDELKGAQWQNAWNHIRRKLNKKISGIYKRNCSKRIRTFF